MLIHLDHPAVPYIVDRGESDGTIQLVLKFGGNRTLEDDASAIGHGTDAKNLQDGRSEHRGRPQHIAYSHDRRPGTELC